MKFHARPSKLNGEITVPGSKSHTIRALMCGLLAEGESRIDSPLDSSDTRSCYGMVRQFGADVREHGRSWVVRGTGGDLKVPDDIVDVGNSGTTLYFGMGVAALCRGSIVFTGDHQTRNRPADQLIDALNRLGASAFSTRGNGKPPVVITGKMRGGAASVEAHTSQYLSALLLAAPLASKDVTIEVPLLNEAPYVTMTLKWMERLGINCDSEGFRKFHVRGRQRYRSFHESIPADFSSATFFLAASAITGSEMVLHGLDYTDSQGDKEVVNILMKMGADVEISDTWIRIRGGRLKGGVFDLNPIPDSLPALAVTACFAEGETRLINVPQARLKETDRIHVMYEELKKMGASIEELPDGLVIRRSELRGASVRGHGDHRVVMALSVAGLASEGETVVDTAESVSVTFPEFSRLIRTAGADIEVVED